MAKTTPGMALGLMLFCMAGCQENPFVPPPEQDSTSGSVLNPEELRFSDPQTGERFLALDACIKEYTGEDDAWRTSGYQRLGNSFEGRWCRGAGALADCEIKHSTREKRDQHIINLTTFFDSPDDTKVSGLRLSALRVPAEAGWAAFINYSEGEIAWVDFWYHESGYWDPDEEIERVSIIGPLSYNVVETTIRAPDTLSLSRREKLTGVLASPESMRDMALHYYQVLATEVDSALRAGEISTCDYEEYQGDGIPPVCTPRPFSDKELAAELERAEEYFSGQQTLLQENYREMYAALFQAFPFDRCQP